MKRRLLEAEPEADYLIDERHKNLLSAIAYRLQKISPSLEEKFPDSIGFFIDAAVGRLDADAGSFSGKAALHDFLIVLFEEPVLVLALQLLNFFKVD